MTSGPPDGLSGPALVDAALEIALAAHRGRRDKAGAAYVLHPLRVMMKMKGEPAMAAALLHDVLEDSDLTAGDLRRAGMPTPVVDAVICLTRRPGESYGQFVDRVRENRLARIVKIADLEDNIDVLRLGRLSRRDLDRVARYHRAWHRLKAAE